MSDRDRDVRRVIVIEGLANLLVLGLKLTVALSTGSLAVLGDAIHSLTDVSNNAIAWVVMRMSARPPDRGHPYGHRKFETLAVFVLATLLTVLAFELALYAVRRQHTPVVASNWTLAMMVIVLVVNSSLAWWERRWARRLKSDLLLADATHTMADVLTTVVVIVGWQLSAFGYAWLDSVCAVAVSVLVLYLAFGLFKRAIPVLVDGAAIEPEPINKAVRGIDGVREVCQLRSRWIGSTKCVDMVIKVDPALSTFYRQGCVCPIGAIQNVTAALADPNLAVPFAVLLFFLLPLVAALLVGRVFCAGVCPLGAIQDLVVLRPVQLPHAIDRWGGKFKYVYLAAAIWFAAQPEAARDFVICRFDPFVGFFRLSGAAWLLTLGGGLLLLGTVIGRPYCRFLCPYGGLLAIVARFAVKPVQITPDEELDCGLCAESCPFGAIQNLRADRATCFACARCFAHCPRQQYQWGQIELVDIENLTKTQPTEAAADPEPVV